MLREQLKSKNNVHHYSRDNGGLIPFAALAMMLIPASCPSSSLQRAKWLREKWWACSMNIFFYRISFLITDSAIPARTIENIPGLRFGLKESHSANLPSKLRLTFFF
jgi:hypothetical protein